ncbi:uncharacterized protein CC84DRAFT_1168101 [Paraphaeosphaeria sporulosa]|uniref:Uncharacterized protein n=1 Tax=Paraphaeosphaeria sporulosa TaxID=1460663 RepID=A0A177C2L9_9PLEO|nr:uncharacterized protein CC84DRAFT_1168101 [Paraphaeosphaeria sporulosa]OAG00880.1 hypothetical protein CC84DRAFT_1168101 [Paraphaeosphaeria sporulosa]
MRSMRSKTSSAHFIALPGCTLGFKGTWDAATSMTWRLLLRIQVAGNRSSEVNEWDRRRDMIMELSIPGLWPIYLVLHACSASQTPGHKIGSTKDQTPSI